MYIQTLVASLPLFSSSKSAEDQHQAEADYPPVFNFYRLYFFCGVLMIGNFCPKAHPSYGKKLKEVSALDQATCGILIFVGLTGL